MRFPLNWRLSLSHVLLSLLLFDPATSAAPTTMGYTLKPRAIPWVSNVVTWDRKANELDSARDPRRPSGSGKVR
jgi:gamma-glutamyltranspeptidase/glutathione hydrolase